METSLSYMCQADRHYISFEVVTPFYLPVRLDSAIGTENLSSTMEKKRPAMIILFMYAWKEEAPIEKI